MTNSLLPPRYVRRNEVREGPGNGPQRRNPPRPLLPAGVTVRRATGLLPPRYHAPGLVSAGKTASADSLWVVLPDSEGGFRQVSTRTVTVQDGDREVTLRVRTPAQALRYRIAVNLLAIVVGLAILFATVWLALHGYI